MKLTNQKIVDLKIRGLTISEAKEILEKVREVEQRNPERIFFVQMLGLEHKSLKEVEEFMKEIFPKNETLSDISPRFTVFSREKVK